MFVSRLFFSCLLALGVFTSAGGAAARAATLDVHRPDEAEQAALAAYYPQGKIVKAIAYRDAAGAARTLVVGGDFGPPALDGVGMNTLHAYGLADINGQRQTRWEITQASGPSCVIEPLVKHIDVQDPDGSGEPVVLVSYWIGCDEPDPPSATLIIYYHDQRYAIRAALPRQEGEHATRTPSDNFRTLPASLQKFIWNYWAGVEKDAVEAGDDDPHAQDPGATQ